MLKNRKKGFTLIELLVVIAIIGMLAATVLVSLGTARSKGRDAKRIADLKNIELAIQLYADSNKGAVPASIAALSPDTGVKYLAKEPKDPNTDVPYFYTQCGQVPGNTSKYLKYHLGTALENVSPVHDGDADPATGSLGTCASTDFSGDDTKDCANGTTGYCYDLTN